MFELSRVTEFTKPLSEVWNFVNHKDFGQGFALGLSVGLTALVAIVCFKNYMSSPKDVSTDRTFKNIKSISVIETQPYPPAVEGSNCRVTLKSGEIWEFNWSPLPKEDDLISKLKSYVEEKKY